MIIVTRDTVLSVVRDTLRLVDTVRLSRAVETPDGSNWSLPPALLQDGLSTFFGALFGAMLGMGSALLQDHLRRNRERQARHHTALVLMEYRLNGHLAVMNDDVYLIDHFRGVVSKGHIHYSLPRTLGIQDPEYRDLLNLEVINDYFALNETLRKVNDDLENILNAYRKLADLYVSRTIPSQEYLTNALLLAARLEAIARALRAKNEDVRRLLAKSRALARKDSPSNRKLWWSTETASITADELSVEMAALSHEIAETERKSRAEIDSILVTDEKAAQ